MSGRPMPRPPGGGEGTPARPASGGGQRPARPRSAIRMLPEPGQGGGAASSSDLASQLGLDAGSRSSVAGTQAKMDRARDRVVRAPGSAMDESDSDSDSSSDGGGAPPPQRAGAARPQRRRLLPAAGSQAAGGGSQFKMMRVPTAVKKEAPPRTPTGARPRVAVQQRGETPTGSRRGSNASSAATRDAEMSQLASTQNQDPMDFTAVPIAPASQGQLKGSKGLASPHELADYTKRKVAEIMQRERQTLTRDVGGRTSRMSDASSVGSLDMDKIRAVRGTKEKEDESESSEEDEAEDDADQLFMMELKKEDLSRNTKFVLCLGFTGLILGFLAIFLLLIQVSITRECDKPWFHDTQHFSYSAAPRCGWMKRCGNIGGVTCSSEPIECWLEEIEVTHFRGAVTMQLLPPPAVGETQENLTATITHFGATRKGINGIQSFVESEDKSLDIFSADTSVMTQDTSVDKLINCRKSDITVNLPGDLGTNQCGPSDPDCGRRVARTLDEFPSIKVTTKYGSIVLPKSNDFYFKGIDLTTEESDLEYDAIRSSSLAFASKNGALKLTGPQAHHMTVKTEAGPIYASAYVPPFNPATSTHKHTRAHTRLPACLPACLLPSGCALCSRCRRARCESYCRYR